MSRRILHRDAVPLSVEPPWQPAETLVSRVGSWMQDAMRRRRQRNALARLDARTLKDIGVTCADAEFEANKPFWRR